VKADRTRTVHTLAAAALITTLLFAVPAEIAGGALPAPYLADNFVSAKVSPRVWKQWWGRVEIMGGQASLSSAAPSSPDETHSALVTSRGAWKDFIFSYQTKTVRQLRLNDPPNTWEVGWSMFRFRDLHNYYYFVLKPNGYELGKKHGSDRQIFLETGGSSTLAAGRSYRVQIAVEKANIKVWVDGARIIDYTDPNPILSGSVGLYQEDSHVHFDSVKVLAARPYASVRASAY